MVVKSRSNTKEVLLKEGQILRGDVDGDGQVELTDVTVLITALLTEDFSSVNMEAADFNEDGAVNIADVTLLINYIASL